MLKQLRLCLLLLLVVLLPVRGAMAGAMLCPPGGDGHQTEMRVDIHPVGHQHQEAPAGAAAHAHGSHGYAASGHGAWGAAASSASELQHAQAPDSAHDECTMCSAFCSVTPLIGSAPASVVPLAVTFLRYPTPDAPAALFLSDGQDRPPRST